MLHRRFCHSVEKYKCILIRGRWQLFWWSTCWGECLWMTTYASEDLVLVITKSIIIIIITSSSCSSSSSSSSTTRLQWRLVGRLTEQTRRAIIDASITSTTTDSEDADDELKANYDNTWHCFNGSISMCVVWSYNNNSCTSYTWRVILHPPCTDEHRVILTLTVCHAITSLYSIHLIACLAAVIYCTRWHTQYRCVQLDRYWQSP